MPFVDTNILVYARDTSDPVKQARAAEIMAVLWRNRTGRLSAQVLQEYYVTVTRKLKPGLPLSEARQDVRDLMEWNPRQVGAGVLESAWEIEDRWQLSWWDSLIAASALLLACAGSHAASTFTFADTPGSHLDICKNGVPLVRYQYHYDNSSPEKLLETYKPIFHVMNPQGTAPITKGAGGDFTHHRGWFIGWSKITTPAGTVGRRCAGCRSVSRGAR